MSIKEWLMSAAGAAYLTQEYVIGLRSTYDLAKEKSTYPNMIRRALIHHSLQRRTKEDAQKQALKFGRHPHPTKGKPRPAETREQISKGMKHAKQKDAAFPFIEY